MSVNAHDYYDFIYERFSSDSAPQSWGGVSGGGLWQITLKREGATIVDTKALLAGIAFFQHEPAKGPFWIKCHGLKSVYEIAYEAIRAR